MNPNTHNMKTKIKIASYCMIMAALGMNVNAQVGIGVASPHASSILDMTNSNNKGVLFPIANVVPSSLTAPAEGLVIYYQSGLYLRDSAGFNHMNPWKYKYNGSTTEGMSFNPPSMTGVGIGVNTAGILGNLHVSSIGKEVDATGNSAAFFIGSTTGANHMIFDADEIMVKSGPNTGGLLKLQEGAGSLQIGLGTDTINNTDSIFSYLHTKIGTSGINRSLTVYGNIDAKAKVQENGHDLLPSGSIIMWYGTGIPEGWALCNGDSLTPDLRDRMVYGGEPGGTNYQSAQGANTRALSIANLPNHVHKGATDNGGGAHQHTNQENATADNDDFDGIGRYIGGRGGSFNNDGGDGFIRSDGSAHNHDITTDECVGCSATPVDVRSAYYVLAFIMKL